MKRKKLVLVALICILIFRYVYKEYFVFSKYRKRNIFGTHRVYVIQKIKDEDYVSYLVGNMENKKFILNIFKDREKDIPKECFKYGYGDVLDVKGTINCIEVLGNPHEFDYNRYLNSKNICTTITTYNTKKVGEIQGIFLMKVSCWIRDFFNQKIKEQLPEREGNLFKSMLYGDTIYLDKSLEDYFSKIGITHLLAVSGSNVASVVAISYIVLKKLGLSENVANVYAIILVIVFTIISSLELSIVRASLMVCILILSKMTNKKYNIWASLVISFYIILLYNPHSIYNVGMQLSFFATIGIVMFYKDINNLLLKCFKDKFKTVISMLSVTIAAQIMILPLQINYFNSFNVIMFVSNIIAVYIADIIGSIGFMYLFISWIPIVNIVIINMTYVFLLMLIYVSKLLSIFSFLELRLPSLNLFIIFSYYLFVIYMHIGKDNRKKYLLCLLLIICIIISSIYSIYLDNYIIYFNVGQGDMSLIKYLDYTVLIDAGSTKAGVASNVLTNFCKKKGISEIDYLIVSHAHLDHYNGIIEISKKIRVKNLVYARDDVIECIQEQETLNVNINKIKKLAGDSIKLLDNFNIEIISPSEETIVDADIKNSNSLVCVVNINNKKYLYTGDATTASEKYFLKNYIGKVEVLKLGHHGSKTSTTDYLLLQTNPNNILISCKRNVFGHPHVEVIERIKKYGLNYHITEIKKYLKINLFLF